MTAPAHNFRVHMNGRLRRAGLAGDFAVASVSRDGLTIKGATSGSTQVPWTRIARGRIGYTETKYGVIYEARMWTDDEPALTLFPLDLDEHAAYAGAMRSLARELAAIGRLERIETGVSKFEALVGPMLVGIVVAAALLVAGYAMHPPLWWHFIVIPGVPATAFAVLTWMAVTVHWPRPLDHLAALDRQLPR
jgi:hypothetical protein